MIYSNTPLEIGVFASDIQNVGDMYTSCSSGEFIDDIKNWEYSLQLHRGANSGVPSANVNSLLIYRKNSINQLMSQAKIYKCIIYNKLIQDGIIGTDKGKVNRIFYDEGYSRDVGLITVMKEDLPYKEHNVGNDEDDNVSNSPSLYGKNRVVIGIPTSVISSITELVLSSKTGFYGLPTNLGSNNVYTYLSCRIYDKDNHRLGNPHNCTFTVKGADGSHLIGRLRGMLNSTAHHFLSDTIMSFKATKIYNQNINGTSNSNWILQVHVNTAQIYSLIPAICTYIPEYIDGDSIMAYS